jgi:hypothetical protein
MHRLAQILVALAAFHLPPSSASLVQDPAPQLDALRERLKEEKRLWRSAYRDATDDEQRAALRAEFPLQEFVAPLAALADQAKGTDLQAQCWLEVYRLGVLVEDRATFQRAVEQLTSQCLTAPSLPNFTLELAYGAPEWGLATAQDALRKILAGTKDATVRANALSQLALLVGLDASLGQAGLDEASALLAQIQTEFGDKDFLGQSASKFVEGARYEIEHLRVGQVAPDFELPDQDGTPLKLSDYRGQVVLLDFWGFV